MLYNQTMTGHLKPNPAKGQRLETRDLCVFLGILFFLYLSYQSALNGHYVFHDDVYFWQKNGPGFVKHPLHDINAAMGRPIGAET